MSSSNKQRARLSFLAGCLCAVSLVASAASEDDFNAAYESYRTAAAERRHAEAAEHAARAKQLGEALFPDDARRMAMLVYNHGFALSQTNRRAEAYEVLELALANLWLGKIRLARGWGDAVEHFEVALAHAGRGEVWQPNQRSIALLAQLALVEAFERQGRRDAATVHCLAIGRSVPWVGKADYEPLYRVPPVYPTSEWKRRREGWVNMEFAVDENGIVRDPKVVESEGGPGFEVSALEAMRGFRYAPRFVDGNAVAVAGVRSLIKFEIDDR